MEQLGSGLLSDPFFAYFISMPGLTPTSLLGFFLLGLMRFGPIAVLAPFLGAKVAPVMARAGIAIFLSLLFLPIIVGSANSLYLAQSDFLIVSFKEVIVGLVIAFISLIPFLIAQSMGITIDHMRGSSQMMSQDPTMQSQASPIGILHNYLTIVLFYHFGGAEQFYDVIASSYDVIAPDGFLPTAAFEANSALWTFSSGLMQRIFAMSIRLASPALLAILMAETFLGIANRLAPQVQIAFLGMSLKSLMGLFLLWTSFFLIIKYLNIETHKYIEAVQSLLNLLHLENFKT